MPSRPRSNLTLLLKQYAEGEPGAMEKIAPEVYAELRKVAKNYMRRERPSHTLQPTALVNEAFLKIFNGKEVQWESRAHFFAVAAQIMRHILMDHAKGKKRVKRGGGAVRVTFDEKIHFSEKAGTDLLALDGALKNLAEIDARRARIVELRYFGGLSVEETAAVLGMSPTTVKRDWALARAWLHRELSKEEAA